MRLSFILSRVISLTFPVILGRHICVADSSSKPIQRSPSYPKLKWAYICNPTFIFAFLLTGCAARMMSEVTEFHTLPPQSQKTFTVSPAEAGSLEAASYGDLIARHLEEHGWTRTTGLTDITVTFSYGIDNGHTIVTDSPVFGQTGGGTTLSNGMIIGSGGMATYSGSSYTPATFGVVGTRQVTSMIYTRVLSVTMTDTKSRKPVFEAIVRSQGASDTFAAVAPCLVDAMFKKFPGKSGSTETVVIPKSECVKSN